MFCHAMSCPASRQPDSACARGRAGGPVFRILRMDSPFRSVPSAPPQGPRGSGLPMPGRYPTLLDRAGRVADTAAPACEPGQEPVTPLCPEGAETPRGCHEMSCSVMRCHVPPRHARLRPPRRSFAGPHPAYRSSFRFRSVRAAAGLPAARPFFARIACVHAPAFAPARFARLIARVDKRRAHVSRPFRWGFFAPARGRRRSGPRMPLPPVSSYHGFTGVKSLPGIIS